MPDTDLTPVSAQVYTEPPGGPLTQVQSMTMTPARRLRVDVAAVPGAPIPVVGKADEIVVEEENAVTLATSMLPAAPPEFGPKVWNVDSSIKHFTVSAEIGTGNGEVRIEYRVDAGAWKTYEIIPLAIGQVINKMYVPTRGRYRVYYYSNLASSGVDLNVILHPQT